VTNKTAWVRTYLRSGQDPAFDNGQLAGVNGTLRVESARRRRVEHDRQPAGAGRPDLGFAAAGSARSAST
jgi:hypothetical protein